LLSRSFQKGDRVYYSGADRKIQGDYGNQLLTVLAVDPVSRRLVCTTKDNRWLVGVSFAELKIDSTASVAG
jgi:hypothetical protein